MIFISAWALDRAAYGLCLLWWCYLSEAWQEHELEENRYRKDDEKCYHCSYTLEIAPHSLNTVSPIRRYGEDLRLRYRVVRWR